VATFFMLHRGAKVASTVLMGPMSRGFVKAIHVFAHREGVEIVPFAKGQRKDEVTGRRSAPGSSRSMRRRGWERRGRRWMLGADRHRRQAISRRVMPATAASRSPRAV
jgi:hypothetical protein